jgi:hypothetical protein
VRANHQYGRQWLLPKQRVRLLRMQSPRQRMRSRPRRPLARRLPRHRHAVARKARTTGRGVAMGAAQPQLESQKLSWRPQATTCAPPSSPAPRKPTPQPRGRQRSGTPKITSHHPARQAPRPKITSENHFRKSPPQTAAAATLARSDITSPEPRQAAPARSPACEVIPRPVPRAGATTRILRRITGAAEATWQ